MHMYKKTCAILSDDSFFVIALFIKTLRKKHTYFLKSKLFFLQIFLSPCCLQIPITLHKEKDYNEEGREVLKCGFKIGGGIDQDYKKSPQGYTDYVSQI